MSVCDRLQPARLLYPWDPPGKNSGVGSHSLLQGIFLIQGSNLGFPALQVDSLPSEPLEKPNNGVTGLHQGYHLNEMRNWEKVCWKSKVTEKVPLLVNFSKNNNNNKNTDFLNLDKENHIPPLELQLGLPKPPNRRSSTFGKSKWNKTPLLTQPRILLQVKWPQGTMN